MTRPADGLVPAPTGSQAAAFDRTASEEHGVGGTVLMESAGRAAADLVEVLYPRGRVLGVVGTGNNGGDALVALRTLAARGRAVEFVQVGDRDPDDPLLHGWSVPARSDRGMEPGDWDDLVTGAAVVVDGLLGTGIRGAPRERQAAVIRRLDEAEAPVLALDVPSGVDADTGAVAGEAVHADVTVAFGAPKLGTLLHPGRGRAGRLVAVEIGFPPMDGPASDEGWARVATAGWARGRLPHRDLDTHKNAVGRVLVVAGGAGMAGAAVLSARAAYRAGAGYVQVCSAAANREVLQRAVPEATFLAWDDGGVEDAVDAAGALAVGPGLGTDEAAEGVLTRVWAAGARPTVLDADALNLLAAGRGPSLPGEADRPLLLTPHPGEMRRLVPPADEGRDDGPEGSGTPHRPDWARRGAGALGAVLLLKGSPSVVAHPDGRLRVDVAGTSDLAVAGMGDVLTGVTASLLAQGLDPFDAGSVGLWLSGRAAAATGRGPGLLPTDVVDALSGVLTGAAPSDPPLVPSVLLDLPAPR